MIGALYEFGKILTKSKPNLGEVSPEKVSADKLIILDFDLEGNLIDIEESRNISELVDKLLYKKVRASRRCNSCTPTFFLNVKEPNKSIKCLKAIFNWLERYNSGIPELRDFEKITTALESHLLNFPPKKKEKMLLTIRIDGKFPAEIPAIVDAFKKGYLEELGSTDGVCALCGKKTKVSGKKSPFAFYTLDKIGYLSGFSIERYYRGFPLCFKCLQILEEANKKVEKHTFVITTFVITKVAPRY